MKWKIPVLLVLIAGLLTLPSLALAQIPQAFDPQMQYDEECCAMATAYGTPLADELNILREFRDEVMLESSIGAGFVALYYEVSPTVAHLISERPVLRALVREVVLDPLVAVLEVSEGVWTN